MNEVVFSFERLDVYQVSRSFVMDVYKLVSTFPAEERFALSSQIRRAAVSITANIAEGCGRNSIKEKMHFIEIAYGSLLEVFSELQVAQDLGYLDANQVDGLRVTVVSISKMLSGLKASYERQLPHK